MTFERFILLITASICVMSPALATEKQHVQASPALTEAAPKLNNLLQASAQMRPLTTHADIARQLLGPAYVSPVAQNLPK